MYCITNYKNYMMYFFDINASIPPSRSGDTIAALVFHSDINKFANKIHSLKAPFAYDPTLDSESDAARIHQVPWPKLSRRLDGFLVGEATYAPEDQHVT